VGGPPHVVEEAGEGHATARELGEVVARRSGAGSACAARGGLDVDIDDGPHARELGELLVRDAAGLDDLPHELRKGRQEAVRGKNGVRRPARELLDRVLAKGLLEGAISAALPKGGPFR